MLRVGLTGSIAVGKSFVAKVLQDFGCFVLDADVAARDVVLRGTRGLDAVVAAFGSEVLNAEGMLDRARLANIVFSDERKRQLLNSILHPLIIAAQDEQLLKWERESPDRIAVVDAALMIESGSYKRFDCLIVVVSRPEVQLARLMNRDGLTQQDAERRIAAQMPQEEKKAYADFVIDTSNGFEDTREQTQVVFENLQRLKAQRLPREAPAQDENAEKT
jgi:dephospho-CoA kinase